MPLTKGQAQAKLKRALEAEGFTVKPWNKKTDQGWLTRLYLTRSGREVGYIAINVGAIKNRVEPPKPHLPIGLRRVTVHGEVEDIIMSHLHQHGTPVARLTGGRR